MPCCVDKIVAALAAHGICEEPMSETITVGLGERAYDIHVGGGLLARAGELLKPLTPKAWCRW